MRVTKASQWRPATEEGNRSWSRANRRKRLAQAKERSTTQRLGNRTNPRLASASLTTINSTPCLAAWAAGPSPEARRSVAGLPFGRQVSRIASLLYCRPVCGTIRATTPSARRPGAGAVPGRRGLAWR